MKRALLSALIIWSGVAGANTDALDQQVTLRNESDLVQAVGLTLQHVLATSEQGRESPARSGVFPSASSRPAVSICASRASASA